MIAHSDDDWDDRGGIEAKRPKEMLLDETGEELRFMDHSGG